MLGLSKAGEGEIKFGGLEELSRGWGQRKCKRRSSSANE